MRKTVRLCVLSLALCCALTSASPFAADATSFNPVPITIAAKSTGGGVPIGSIISWPVATNPEDMDKWLECNGQAINSAVYPELAALMGGRVPDLRGLFLRGYGSQSHSQNNGSTVGVSNTTHSSGALGAVQGDAMRRMGADSIHIGNAATYLLGGKNMTLTGLGRDSPVNYDIGGCFLTIDYGRSLPMDTEIRPANRAVRYFIRAAK